MRSTSIRLLGATLTLIVLAGLTAAQAWAIQPHPFRGDRTAM